MTITITITITTNLCYDMISIIQNQSSLLLLLLINPHIQHIPHAHIVTVIIIPTNNTIMLLLQHLQIQINYQLFNLLFIPYTLNHPILPPT